METQGSARVLAQDVNSPSYFWKQVVAGMFITIAMTGMDQEMMQKISRCAPFGAQKNMVLLTVILTAKGDQLFPAIVMGHMPARL